MTGLEEKAKVSQLSSQDDELVKVGRSEPTHWTALASSAPSLCPSSQ